MVTYLSRFISKISNRTCAPKKLLNKKSETFCTGAALKHWSILFLQCQFYLTLTVIKNNNFLLMLVSIGSGLLQDDCPIWYSSKSLSETQQAYSQIEKELLAVVLMKVAKNATSPIIYLEYNLQYWKWSQTLNRNSQKANIIIMSIFAAMFLELLRSIFNIKLWAWYVKVLAD